MAHQTTTEVLIVGAGPTGLTLANELALTATPFRLVDKQTVRSDKSRALVVQPRTQELLNRYGDAAKTYVASGIHGMGAAIYVNRRKVYDIDMSDLGFRDTAFPLLAVISQAETERFLEERLEVIGGHVERGVVVGDITQDEDGATATLGRADGTTETVRAKYIVGCDGAHSPVRHAADLNFDGEAYQQSFLLADLRMEWPDGPRDDRMAVFLGQGVLVLFPLPGGMTRMVASPRAAALASLADDETPTTLAPFEETWKMFGVGDATLRNATWLARFRLHHRGVERYRAGRLFVAGDAAHIHSPAGGQGMNTGIQDAINLGWKLALVLKGQRPEAFLDSYHEERWPVGRRLLGGTDRLFSFMATRSWLVAVVRNALLPWILPLVAGSAARRARLFRFISQLGVRYRRSGIVRTAKGHAGPVLGGDRAPDGRVRRLGDGGGRESWLLDWCRGCNYDLILFSGVGNKAVNAQTLRQAADRFREENKINENCGLVLILGSDETAAAWEQTPENWTAVVDVEGGLHERYGFEGPGLAYVRPDGYVEYVGPLAALDDLLVGQREISAISGS